LKFLDSRFGGNDGGKQLKKVFPTPSFFDGTNSVILLHLVTPFSQKKATVADCLNYTFSSVI
jgi:hypothetical protein